MSKEPGKSATADEDAPAISTKERALLMLLEGAALNMPEIDAESYRAFRANVNRLSLQIPDHLPEGDNLLLVRTIVYEFEECRASAEAALKERTAGWRGLVILLFRDLLSSLGVGAESPQAAALAREIPALASAESLRAWRGKVEEFLHPHDSEGYAHGIAALKNADHSTANDNAAGLRGGGSAVEHVRGILERGDSGFVALFRLGCLDIIRQRFGHEAVEDCLMAVSAFLTASLQGDDAIYHWNDSSLLAVLQGRPSEPILLAELQRIASQNRDSSIQVAGRTIVLRIPLAVELTPIDRLRVAEDLYRLSTQQASKW